MKNLGVLEYPGGVPTSMVPDSKEQWDFPNGFSPLNHMIVEGLRKSQNAQMQDAVGISRNSRNCWNYFVVKS
ncbi:hypothetical protein COOONC_24607 [Cooperia oncophora]